MTMTTVNKMPLAARAAVLLTGLALLALAVGWLIVGSRQYQNVEQFDDQYGNCVACPDIGRPGASWPYSMFTGPDPR